MADTPFIATSADRDQVALDAVHAINKIDDDNYTRATARAQIIIRAAIDAFAPAAGSSPVIAWMVRASDGEVYIDEECLAIDEENAQCTADRLARDDDEPRGWRAFPVCAADGRAGPKQGDVDASGLTYVLCKVDLSQTSRWANWLFIPHADGNYVSAAKLVPFSISIIEHAIGFKGQEVRHG